MNIVVIPVYRKIPTPEEFVSFSRCINILHKHPIAIVTPESLDTQFYEKIAKDKHKVIIKETFSNSYFNDISGYNKLLISEEFYQRFVKYEYMLIYQLDAYVFDDQFSFWTNKGYDFIGAPLILSEHCAGSKDEMIIGNGGFCIRKTSTFINAFKHKSRLLSYKEILKRYDIFNKRKFWKRIPKAALMMLGFRNSFSYFQSTYSHNEDNFWTIFLKNTPLELKVPPINDAISFAFERFPIEMYQLNNKKLPFGCHAWMKYDFENFWKYHIIYDIKK